MTWHPISVSRVETTDDRIATDHGVTDMTKFSTATAIGIIMAATPALAQVTPQATWEQLSSYYESIGLTVETGSVDDAGDTLTVNDLVLKQEGPTGDVSMSFGQMVLTSNGSETVTIDLQDEASGTMSFKYPEDEDQAASDMPADATPGDAADSRMDNADAPDDAGAAGTDAAEPAENDDAPAATDGDDAPAAAGGDDTPAASSGGAVDGADTDGGENDTPDATGAESEADAEPAQAEEEPAVLPTQADFTIRMPGETYTVREDGDTNLYEYSFPTFELSLDRVELSDGAVIDNPASLVISDMQGTDRFVGDAGMNVEQSGTAASMEVNFDFDHDGSAANGSFTSSGLSFDSTAVVPEGVRLDVDFSDAMLAGVDISGGLKAERFGMQMDFSGQDEEGQPQSGSLSSDAEAVSLNFGLSGEELSYGGSSGPANAEMNITDLPTPVSYSTESASFDLSMPIAAADAPQEFNVDYGFDGLTLSDTAWALFDPENALPRDPASLAVELSGLVTLDRSLLDTEATTDPDQAPGSFDALTIENVALSALGADLAVSGQLDAPEGGEMSAPVGQISGRIEGANALLDALGAAGLVPEEQMMGVRMMLAMFAKADPENADVMTTELEFREGGEIHANGQRVK